MITEAEVETLFLRKVRDYVVEENRKRELHLTDLASPCPRQLWFTKHSEYYENPEELLRLWWGKVIHETPLTSNHELKLEYKGVLTSIDEYQDGILIEKKTADFVPNDLSELQRYYSHYINQVRLEALFLTMNGYEVKQAFLLFIKYGQQEERGRRPVRIFDVTQFIDIDETEKMFNEKREEAIAVLSSPDPPPKPNTFLYFDYPCKYCDFKGKCLAMR